MSRKDICDDKVVRVRYPICIKPNEKAADKISEEKVIDYFDLFILGARVKAGFSEAECKKKGSMYIRFILHSNDVIVLNRNILFGLFSSMVERWGKVGQALVYNIGYELGDIICSQLFEENYINPGSDDKEILDNILRAQIVHGFVDTYNVECKEYGVTITMGILCKHSNNPDSKSITESRIYPYNTFLHGLLQGCLDTIYGGILSVLNLSCEFKYPYYKSSFIVKPEYENIDKNDELYSESHEH